MAPYSSSKSHHLSFIANRLSPSNDSHEMLNIPLQGFSLLLAYLDKMIGLGRMYSTSINLSVKILHEYFPRHYAGWREFEKPLLSSLGQGGRKDSVPSVV